MMSMWKQIKASNGNDLIPASLLLQNIGNVSGLGIHIARNIDDYARVKFQKLVQKSFIASLFHQLTQRWWNLPRWIYYQSCVIRWSPYNFKYLISGARQKFGIGNLVRIGIQLGVFDTVSRYFDANDRFEPLATSYRKQPGATICIDEISRLVGET
jgi:hypothetical protein